MTELAEAAGRALRSALGAEHAAVWVYGLGRAYAREARVLAAIDQATDSHEQMRDTATQVIHGAGETPTAAQPAYDVGQPVTDQNSAIQVLIKAENDCEIGWRSVLDNSDDPGLRKTALNGLTAAATRATRWKITLGQQPAAQQFPGQP